MAAANAASARAGPWTVSAQFQLITVGIVPWPGAGAVAVDGSEKQRHQGRAKSAAAPSSARMSPLLLTKVTGQTGGVAAC